MFFLKHAVFLYDYMYTYNITFIVVPDMEPELLRYLREVLLPRISNEMTPATDPQLRKVVEAGGEKPDPEQGLSIALALTLPTEESAHLWHDSTLVPALDDFHLKFGDRALFFITLLENL